MKIRNILLGAAVLLSAAIGVAQAQPDWAPRGNDPRGYYSEFDRNGYYDRDGRYQRIQNGGGRFNREDRARDNFAPPPPPGAGAYYQNGRYEDNCRRGNTAAGTIFGALAGGLIGGAASNGNGGAVAGGAILGGLLGNTISRDIDCEDQPVAFNVYAQGLNGDLNRRYDWRGRNGYGNFTPMREFRRGGMICRDFNEVTYRGGREYSRSGTACREAGGHWRFD